MTMVDIPVTSSLGGNMFFCVAAFTPLTKVPFRCHWSGVVTNDFAIEAVMTFVEKHVAGGFQRFR